MAYATCSLDPMENEAVVAELLRSCDFLRLVDADVEGCCPNLVTRPGMTDWSNDEGPLVPPVEEEIREALTSCVRVWNDENDSGGFFVALLEHVSTWDGAVTSLDPPDTAMLLSEPEMFRGSIFVVSGVVGWY